MRATLHATLGGSTGIAPGGRRVCALVGPTGVGKTTTLAKIAASVNLVSGKRVALMCYSRGLAAYLKRRVATIPVSGPAARR